MRIILSWSELLWKSSILVSCFIFSSRLIVCCSSIAHVPVWQTADFKDVASLILFCDYSFRVQFLFPIQTFVPFWFLASVWFPRLLLNFSLPCDFEFLSKLWFSFWFMSGQCPSFPFNYLWLSVCPFLSSFLANCAIFFWWSQSFSLGLIFVFPAHFIVSGILFVHFHCRNFCWLGQTIPFCLLFFSFQFKCLAVQVSSLEFIFLFHVQFSVQL